MAIDKSTHSPKAPFTTIPGGLSSESVDGKRSDSNPRRVPPSPSPKEQSNPSNRRDDGERGDRAPEGSSSASDIGISVPPAVSQANDPFVSGNYVLKAIMDKFVELRENGKVGAWKQLQTDLMRAAPFLIPHIITLDKVIDIAATIEKEIKGSTMQVGKSNEELLADFLTGGTAIKLAIDNDVRISERDEEPPAVSDEAPA